MSFNTSTNYSVNLNNYTAKLIINPNDTQDKFSLELTNGTQTISILIAQPKITTSTNNKDLSSDSNSSSNTTSKKNCDSTECENKSLSTNDIQKHKQTLTDKLNLIQTTVGKENKTKVAIEIYQYLIDNMDFVKTFNKFKLCAIDKCYELKYEHPEQTQLIEYLDRFLTLLNKSTIVPASFKPGLNPIYPYFFSSPPLSFRYIRSNNCFIHCNSSKCKNYQTPNKCKHSSLRRSQRIANKPKVNYSQYFEQ